MDLELLAELIDTTGTHPLISPVGEDKIELAIEDCEDAVWLDRNRALELARILIKWANP